MRKLTAFQQKLRNHIASVSALSVAEFMAMCVEHYYATRDPFGAEGDFTTAPEISQVFGEIIGAWLAQQWLDNGGGPAILCELGPGRGTLMRDILRATRAVAEFHASLEIRMIENSATLVAKQQQLLQGAHPTITWHEVLEQLPAKPLLLVANEFFDALPIHQYVQSEGMEKERMVTCNEKGFAFSPEGMVSREASPVSCAIMRQIAAHIHLYGGAALCIDYGYQAAPTQDTLQALHKHRYSDVLGNAGEVDLTAHVDFNALVNAAKHMGIVECQVKEQSTFLNDAGGALRVEALCKNATAEQQRMLKSSYDRLVSPTQMGRLFKVMSFAEHGTKRK